MRRVEIVKDARDKEVDRLEDLFHKVHAKDKDPVKRQQIDTATETQGSLNYVCSVKAEGLAKYGLEVPDWEIPEGDTYSVWQRVSSGQYELRRPSPTAFTPTRRAGENKHERVAIVNQEVYFDHLPECAERGRITFKNKREARAYVQRVHGLDLNL